MANINAQPAEIARLGKQIMGKASEYQAEIKKIYATIDDLKLKWTGEAATNFTSKIEGFKNEYTKFGIIINDFGKLLNEIGVAYQNVEKDLKF